MGSIPTIYISRKLPKLPMLDDNDILWVDLGVQMEGPSRSKQDVLIPRFLPGTMIPTFPTSRDHTARRSRTGYNGIH